MCVFCVHSFKHPTRPGSSYLGGKGVLLPALMRLLLRNVGIHIFEGERLGKHLLIPFGHQPQTAPPRVSSKPSLLRTTIFHHVPSMGNDGRDAAGDVVRNQHQQRSHLRGQ